MSSRERPKLPLACSFCGRDEVEAKKLIAGPMVYVCDVCVRSANELVASVGVAPGSASTEVPASVDSVAKGAALLFTLEQASRRFEQAGVPRERIDAFNDAALAFARWHRRP